jgi:hypothetical protein
MKVIPKFFICSDDLITCWNKHGVYFSKKFCNFFSNKSEEIFLREAGLKPSFKVGYSVIGYSLEQIKMYEPGLISRINTFLVILPEFEDKISFCWKSKTGKIIHTYDEDFDEDDLECWIEGIKPQLYREMAYGKINDHPFQIKNLPYQLKVRGFGTHMGLTIQLLEKSRSEIIISTLGDVVEKHNQASETKNRANGIVHNCYGEVNGNEIIFRIDVGSAGVLFIKKLLRALAKFSEVKEVNIDL